MTFYTNTNSSKINFCFNVAFPIVNSSNCSNFKLCIQAQSFSVFLAKNSWISRLSNMKNILFDIFHFIIWRRNGISLAGPCESSVPPWVLPLQAIVNWKNNIHFGYLRIKIVLPFNYFLYLIITYFHLKFLERFELNFF